MDQQNCSFPEFNTLALVNAKICGGHGYCDAGICKCDAGYTGYSDIYNLAGVSCHINTTVTRVLAILGFIQLLHGLAMVIKSGKTQRALFRKRHKKYSLAEARDHPPFQVLGLLCLSAIFGTLYYIREIAVDEISIGDDPVHTVSIWIFLNAYFISTNIMQYSAFQNLFRGLKMGKVKAGVMQKALSNFKFGLIVGNTVYSLAKFGLVVLLFQPHRNRGPWTALNGVVIVLNNLGVFFVLGTSQFYNRKLVSILQEFQKHHTSGQSADKGDGKSKGTTQSSGGRQLEKTITELRKTSKKACVSAFITVSLYGPFTVPVLWGYQDYCVMVGCLLAGAQLTGTAKVYDRKNSDSKTSTRVGPDTSGGGSVQSVQSSAIST